ncbi:hypothetical protein BS47DRAFT_1339400 [Hydnum rufescens UP504]|uniref:DNA recombination and repair protein Rad51-like C-terminal domain-containing protein n=1 Tax=Hydnum rufescens UP504 TaxID=1448309 RepID=A0A9P6B5Z4_9AGAM|nr:hypothetical protein BS47DRAFT_1339400 [Hydnum rufescens UP504]
MESRPLWTLPLPYTVLSALSTAGYETVEDIHSMAATPQTLADEISVPLSSIDSLFYTVNKDGDGHDLKTTSASALLSQEIKPLPVSIPVFGRESLPFSCAVDVSGPPGSGRSIFALQLIREALQLGQEVLILDNQGQLSRERIYRELYSGHRDHHIGTCVHYMRAVNLTEMLAAINTIPSYLERHTKISLLVISSLSVHIGPLPSKTKGQVMSVVKEALSRVCTHHSLAVVTTTSLATKFAGVDGEQSTFDHGAWAYLSPQLNSTFLPDSRSRRVVLSRHESKGTRHAELSTALLSNTSRSWPMPPTAQGIQIPQAPAVIEAP